MVLVLVLCLAIPALAQGYVDPGSGAMIWQILAAGALGGAFLFRRFLTKWFRRNRSRGPE